jgi:hypothetical protein
MRFPVQSFGQVPEIAMLFDQAHQVGRELKKSPLTFQRKGVLDYR